MFMRFLHVSCFCRFSFFVSWNSGHVNEHKQRNGSLDAHFGPITEREKMKNGEATKPVFWKRITGCWSLLLDIRFAIDSF